MTAQHWRRIIARGWARGLQPWEINGKTKKKGKKKKKRQPLHTANEPHQPQRAKDDSRRLQTETRLPIFALGESSLVMKTSGAVEKQVGRGEEEEDEEEKEEEEEKEGLV